MFGFPGEAAMLLPLQVDILYGPVNSRRLGKSLGINLMPGAYKLCSFNCVYCHYGWTKEHTLDASPFAEDLPPLQQVVERLEIAARSALDFDYLTFSGNGEPTLYPQFAELVDEVVRIRNTYRPEVKIALLSNATGLMRAGVRESIPKIDFPLFKLDAGTEETFRAINRPAQGLSLAGVVAQLCSLRDINIQTMLVDGSPSNTREEDLQAYFQLLARIQPKEVHIYSIDRPVPHAQLLLVPPQKLEDIAKRGERETGVRIKAFYARR
jgi:wyosine [tRNA(Phe)-imidazoG37] synthetase (radical SAM superfamily)